MNLEEKIENSENSGFLDRLWKRKWLRRSVLPLAAATSIFFSYPKLSETATSKQQVTLKHDPVLLIHGLKIGQDSLEEYCDFNANKIVDFDDFFLFTEKFGAKEGDPKYDPGFDINRDGDVGLEDFFLFSINFNRTVEPLETTWDALSMSLHRDLKWTNGGTIGKWMPNRDLQSADFYTIRLSSGNKLNFREQGEEVKLAVDKISKVTKKKVILVGFSMGGLAARAYLQNNPDPKASALVTICTPHSGSYLSYLPERSEISRWAASFPKVGWVAQAADFFLFYLSFGKPAINYLEPCSPELEFLNNEIYKMPADINYVDVISQLPDQDLLKKLASSGIDLINKYKQGYQKCRQVASEDLLAKGDGVVPTVSQLLRYAILNTNTKNVGWYEKAKRNITENAEMEVFHTGGNKQTTVIKKVLEDVIEKLKSSDVNHAPNKPSNPSPKNLAVDVPLEVLLDWEGSDPDINDKLTYTVYFEKDDNTPDQLLKSGLTESEIKVSNLENNVTYYWQVIASDGKLSTSGDVWSFATVKKSIINIKDYAPPYKLGDFFTFYYRGSFSGIVSGSITDKKSIDGKDAFVLKDSNGLEQYYGYDNDKWIFYGTKNTSTLEALFQPPIVIGKADMIISEPIKTSGYLKIKSRPDIGTSYTFSAEAKVISIGNDVQYNIPPYGEKKFNNCIYFQLDYHERFPQANFSSDAIDKEFMAPGIGFVEGELYQSFAEGYQVTNIRLDRYLIRSSYLNKPAAAPISGMPFILNVEVGNGISKQ